MSDIRTVTVLGTGVLGSQIAYQAAYSGFAVMAYDINDEATAAGAKRFAELAETYKTQVAGAADGKADAALANLTLTSDLAVAVADADLVIEAVPESIEIKRSTYSKLAELSPAKTIFATNSSTLLPSDMVEFTGRPEKFLAMHFANRIWIHNIAEVMGTPATDPAVVASVLRFGEEIGMVPVEIKKEKAGYLLNSLLVPLLSAAGALLVDGIAEPADIDKAWRIGTGSPAGPFEIYDIVGLNTAYNVSSVGGPKQQEFAALIKENYIDKGKLGVATGEGFYSYPSK